MNYPMKLNLDFQSRNLPYSVDFTITKDGPETDFMDGKGRSPEPMVQFIINEITEGGICPVYVTLKTSAVPLIDDLTETMAMSMVAFHVIFDTSGTHIAGSQENRRRLLEFLREYVGSREQSDQLLPKPTPNKTLLQKNAALIEFANIDLNKFYLVNQFTYQDWSVWVKRELRIPSDHRSGYRVNTRWTFVQRSDLRVVEFGIALQETKQTLEISEMMNYPYVTLNQVSCLLTNDDKDGTTHG